MSTIAEIVQFLEPIKQIQSCKKYTPLFTFSQSQYYLLFETLNSTDQ